MQLSSQRPVLLNSIKMRRQKEKVSKSKEVLNTTPNSTKTVKSQHLFLTKQHKELFELLDEFTTLNDSATLTKTLMLLNHSFTNSKDYTNLTEEFKKDVSWTFIEIMQLSIKLESFVKEVYNG